MPLPGEIIRASDVAVEETTSGLVVATGFSLNSFRAKKTPSVCSVWIYVNVTSAITASGGNIPDTLMCTLPAGYRPPDHVSCSYGNGSMDGEALISPNGAVTLRSANGSISAGSNIRLHATFLL